jgi:hypothetical protein
MRPLVEEVAAPTGGINDIVNLPYVLMVIIAKP